MLITISILTVGQTNAQETDSFWVAGVCGACQTRIQDAALSVEGVQTAVWSQSKQMLYLTIAEGLDIESVHIAVAGVGHETKMYDPHPQVYEALPACCKYRTVDPHTDHIDDPHEHHDHQVDLHDKINGVVYELDSAGNKVPLNGVDIFWATAYEGTITNKKGKFRIRTIEGENRLVISYVGFQNDTVVVEKNGDLEIVLSNAVALGNVNISAKRRTASVSYIQPANMQLITEGELLKAACCNLSESFETNPSVDVAFTDAVTGTRQIKLLGLAGPYVQLTREGIPDVRGLAALQGLTYIPGFWIEGIQLSTGAGSVVNGFESMTGQINVELRKPDEKEQLYFNGYLNEMGRTEFGVSTNQHINDRWSYGLLTQFNVNKIQHDKNHDGFLDHPAGERIVLMNRYKYNGYDGHKAQFGIRGTFDKSIAGQEIINGALPSSAYWTSHMRNDKNRSMGENG